jgi:hypothetical protein
MGTGDTVHGGADRSAAAEAAPVAADRPTVDGTTASASELRAAVTAGTNPDREQVEQLRAEVAETADELAARLDVPARVRSGTREAVSRLRAAGERAAQHPGAVAGAAVLVVLAILATRRRSTG